MYTITIPEKLNSFEFYTTIVPQICKFEELYRNKKDELRIDLSDVDFIKPSILPLLCLIGLKVKQFTGTPSMLYIPWKPKLLGYLDHMGFIDIVRKHDLFDLFEETIGGFSRPNMNPNCKMYLFPAYSKVKEKYMLQGSQHVKQGNHDVEKELYAQHAYRKDISNKLSNLSIIFDAYNRNNKNTLISEQKAYDLIDTATQLIHNAVIHGDSDCPVIFQLDYGERIKYKKLFLSVADSGIGLYNSLISKQPDDYKFRFIDRESLENMDYIPEKNIHSIFEALFFRMNDRVEGIYDVFNNILSNKGRIRINTDNTQLLATPDRFGLYFGEFTIENAKEIMGYFVRKSKALTRFNQIVSDLRIYDYSLNGVQYEMELPIGEK
jgi:hypothetical protein